MVRDFNNNLTQGTLIRLTAEDYVDSPEIYKYDSSTDIDIILTEHLIGVKGFHTKQFGYWRLTLDDGHSDVNKKISYAHINKRRLCEDIIAHYNKYGFPTDEVLNAMIHDAVPQKDFQPK